MSNISTLNRIQYQIDSLSSPNNNTPVTRVSWASDNLPPGLTLSESGLLTGHPTVAGTFDCSVSVSTNWGTNSKNLRIVIQ